MAAVKKRTLSAKQKARVEATAKAGRERRKLKKVENKKAHKSVRDELAKYMPPAARARYKVVIEELNAGAIETDDDKRRAIIGLICGGLSLRWAREIVGVSHVKWHGWLRDVDGLQREYDLAKDERTEAWADDIIEDAESANAFNAQAVRLRIDTKKWLMGKHAGRYADKVVVAGDKENPLTMVDATMTAQEAQEAYNAMKKHVGQNVARLLQLNKPSSDESVSDCPIIEGEIVERDDEAA